MSKIKKLPFIFTIVLSFLALSIGGFIGKKLEANFTILFQGINQLYAPKTYPIRFQQAGNQYPGSIIITDYVDVNQVITFNNQSLLCKRKARGYYFNSARGLRIRPIDTDSLNNLKSYNASYNNLSIVGGLYTTCGSSQDMIGFVSYTDNTLDQGSILFGVTMDFLNNSYIANYSSGSSTIENYTSLSGYMYDTIIGIGNINSSNSICIGGCNGGLSNTFWHLAVQGRLSLSQSIENNERVALKGNIGQKSLIYTSNEITNSTIINIARKNADIYCRSNISTNLSTAIANSSKVICVNAENNSVIIDSNNITSFSGKDLIVFSGDVFIDSSVYATAQPLSIFVNRGNLILDSQITTSDLKNFNKDGYKESTSSVTKGLLLEGNYIVNGMILSALLPTGPVKPIEAKTFLYGKFASLNLPTISNPQREKQIINTVSFRNGQSNELIFKYINLENLFVRRCNPTTGSGEVGPNNPILGPSIQCNGTGDQNYDRSFIVIEKDFPSILLRK